MNIILTLLNYTVRMSTPLFFVIIGGVFVQRAGIFNFALEAAINIGAFTGILFTVLTGQVSIGIIMAIISCVAINLMFGVFVISWKAHPTVVGMAINLLTSAIAPFILSALFNSRGKLVATHIIDPATIPLDIPILRDIPILSNIFNKQTPLTYISFLVVILLTVVYYKTKFGTYVRVTGDNAEAAEAIGINVKSIKMWALVISGACCALAGLNLAVETLGMFTLDMAASRGFICLSAINCGKKQPIRSILFGVLFGFARGLQIVGANYVSATAASLIGALPYVTILVVLVITELPRVRRDPMRIFQDV